MLPLISVINASINVQTGERAHDEESVSSGDIDYVIELKDYIYILEAKLNKSSKEALNSIIDRGYYKKYISENRKLILIGINFNYSKEQKIKRLMDEPEYSVIG